MERATPFKPIGLVVEDEPMQREHATTLLEECEMSVIQCDSAEAAIRVLERLGQDVAMIFTDVQLAGIIDGVELARFAAENYPNVHITVTGQSLTSALPRSATFLPKPWLPLDMLREAERAKH